MTRITPEIWNHLAHERSLGDSLLARLAAPDTTDRLIAAVGAEGGRHLLIRLAGDEKGIQDRNSRGLGVETRELTMSGHEPGSYLDIICHEPTGHEAFDLIGGEIADRLATGLETAPEVVARVIGKWRRFWGQVPRQLLSREEQLGLFAELHFLARWLIPKLGGEEALNRWRGPTGARNDFEWPGNGVEVKATTSTRGRIHRINGLEQLVPPADGRLLFFSLRLHEEASAEETLPLMADACRTVLSEDPATLGKFEDLLMRAGYSPAHEDEYSKTHLRIVEEGLFRVEEDFPRLTPASFPGGIPAGLERVEYEINLAVCAHLLIASSAAECGSDWIA